MVATAPGHTVGPARRLAGTLTVPGDKSISHRALLLNALATGPAHVRGLGLGADVRSTAHCLRALGVAIALEGAPSPPVGGAPAPQPSPPILGEREQTRGSPRLHPTSGERGQPTTALTPPPGLGGAGGGLTGGGAAGEERPGAASVEGVGLHGLREPDDVLDAGNSGTTMRLLSGVLAGQDFFAVLTGDGSLRRRPMARVLEPLRAMGAQAWGRAGGTLAPFAIQGGHLRGLDYTLPVASAQLKSALLLAALYADGPTHLREPAASRDHTERMLRAQGVDLRVDGLDLTLTPPTAPLRPIDLTVPGDFSSAAFWLVAACIHPDARVTVEGVGMNPGRTGLLDVLAAMGARITVAHARDVGGEPVADLTAESSALRGVAIGGDLIPRLLDEVPVLAVAMAVADGPSRIDDAAELRVKESDRLAAVARELTALGAAIEERPAGLAFAGGNRLHGATVHSHDDHRLAMALAIAALIADGPTTIAAADSVAISYPAFWARLAALAA